MKEFLTGLVAKIFSIVDMAKAIAFIISALNKPVTDFMDRLIDAWNEILSAIEDPKKLEEQKQVAHSDVKAQTKSHFSASPSWVPDWLIDVYIKVRVAADKPEEHYTGPMKEHGLFSTPETGEEYQDHYIKIFGNR